MSKVLETPATIIAQSEELISHTAGEMYNVQATFKT